jgi:hypothetical protein
MSEVNEKVWVKGPAGAIVTLVIGVEIDQDNFDKRVANGELTIVDNPAKSATPKKVPSKKSDAVE